MHGFESGSTECTDYFEVNFHFNILSSLTQEYVKSPCLFYDLFGISEEYFVLFNIQVLHNFVKVIPACVKLFNG